MSIAAQKAVAMAPDPVTLPHTAMVLAAGLGRRMMPLTRDLPKPLLKVGGRSMLDWNLDHLATAGVARAVVNCFYLGDKLVAHLAGRARPEIIISREAEMLETGGGIRHALALLGDDPILCLNADVVWLDGPTPALRRLARAWDPDRMDALLMLQRTVRAHGFDGTGDFTVDPVGRLARRAERLVAPYVFTGVQIIKPELFAAFPEGAFSTNRVWDGLMDRGRLYGMIHDGAWFHVGTPDALAEADRLLSPDEALWLDLDR